MLLEENAFTANFWRTFLFPGLFGCLSACLSLSIISIDQHYILLWLSEPECLLLLKSNYCIFILKFCRSLWMRDLSCNAHMYRGRDTESEDVHSCLARNSNTVYQCWSDPALVRMLDAMPFSCS